MLRQPIADAERGGKFWRVMSRGEMTLDIAVARQDILAAGDELVAGHPEVRAVVIEWTNMVPFARALRRRLQKPVYTQDKGTSSTDLAGGAANTGETPSSIAYIGRAELKLIARQQTEGLTP